MLTKFPVKMSTGFKPVDKINNEFNHFGPIYFEKIPGNRVDVFTSIQINMKLQTTTSMEKGPS
jgi:hypothetical protein